MDYHKRDNVARKFLLGGTRFAYHRLRFLSFFLLSVAWRGRGSVGFSGRIYTLLRR
jgi:hypothetical protein